MSDATKAESHASVNAGRVVMILVAISLMAIGSLFIGLMARSYLRAKKMRSWPEVPCVILESNVEERQHDPYSPPEFGHQITFGYEWDGQALTSRTVTLRGEKWSSKRADAFEGMAKYPAGSQQTCRVNPAKADQAVLETDSLAPLYSIWFPALFVVGGAGLLVTSLRPQKRS